jgi:hypothetical protein
MSVSDGGDSIVLTCTGTTTCDCTVDVTASGATETGTYTTSGTNLIEDGTTTTPYCVQGSELHISPTAMSGMDVTGSVVLKK